MKLRTETFTHKQRIEVGGDIGSTGNGIQLRPGDATAAIPEIRAVGDDASVSLVASIKVASAVQQRFFANAGVKTIVDGSATALASIPIAALGMVGGFIDFMVRATDGTDMQVLCGRAVYAAVNKAGTVTATITYTTAPEAKAVSAGTLTLSFTAAENPADTLELRVQPTGSLTETTYTIEYNVQPIRGTVTIL